MTDTTLFSLIRLLRPWQWIKNFFLFAPLIFSENALHPVLLTRAAAAFILFCAASSAGYIFNDLQDVEEDRHHPMKSMRPLASEQVTRGQAKALFGLLVLLSVGPAVLLTFSFAVVLAGYLVMQTAYSLRLKNVVILDVFIVAAGFFLRVIAGALVISVYISPWLLICTLLLSLFLAMSKRRHELIVLGSDAGRHRPILDEYSPYLLDQMIAVVTASTVVAYCLYTVSPETMTKFGTRNLIFTVPFVLYGIFRYLYLIHRRAEGGSPEILIVKDRPLLLSIFLWVVTIFLFIYLKV